MKSKFVKTWFIIAGSLVGVSVLYYIIRLIDLIVNPNQIEGTLLAKLNIYAIILLGLALLMFIVIIPLSKKIEEYEAKKESAKVDDKVILAKYKSKKNK